MTLLGIYFSIFQISVTFAFNYIPSYMNLKFEPNASYCEQISCKKKTHAYCHNETYKSPVEPLGPSSSAIYLDSSVKLDLVKLQNDYRNLVANSNKKLVNLDRDPLPNAAKMHELVWDSELEFVAKNITETCRMDMDYCPSTAGHPEAGKIMSQRAYSTDMSHTDVMNDMVLSWFTSYVNVPLKIIRKFQANQPIRRTLKDFSEKEIWEIREMGGHRKYVLKTFDILQLIQDDTKRVGCSLFSCGRKNGQIQYMLTCVYDRANIEGERVYEESEKPAELCDDISTYHCYLCAVGEINITYADNRSVQCEKPAQMEVFDQLADFSNGNGKVQVILQTLLLFTFLFLLISN